VPSITSQCVCMRAFLCPPLVPPCSTVFPYTTLFRSGWHRWTTGADPATRFSGADAATAGSGDGPARIRGAGRAAAAGTVAADARSEEHTSELQSRENLVCRLLLEKKNNQ